ncbi:serine-rich adhesin for platelets-like [Argopecten irradians]|uniref:serine-rich adhesin for platelets-like n=1 Tax=Argopecten irradians TaxID=31199 RepID=UPI0037187890
MIHTDSMEGASIQELLQGIQESLNQHWTLLQKNNKKINSIKKRVKSIEHQIYDNHTATTRTLEYVHEDCQNILENTVDLQSKAKRSRRLIENLGSGLKVPMDKYISDSDSFSKRNIPPHNGSRRNRQPRRHLGPVNHKSFSTSASDSDSDSDISSGQQAGNHRLIPSGHKSISHRDSQGQSQGETCVTEEVPTTVPPMHDVIGDIQALQAAASNPIGQSGPVPGQQANLSGQTVPTNSTSNIVMSPIEQPSSSTRQKEFSSSTGSNSSLNPMEQRNILTPSQSNIPPKSRHPSILVSGGQHSTQSMMLDERPNIDAPPRSADSSPSMVPTTANVTIQNQASQQTTTASPRPLETTTPQTTPSTTVQTTPTAGSSNAMPNIQVTKNSNGAAANYSLTGFSNVQNKPSSSYSKQATVPIPGEMGLFLEPDFSSPEKVIESLGLPDNDDTKRAVNTAFARDGEPSMERPKGLYTVLLVDTSYSTRVQSAKPIIENFIESFMDEIEDSAANETLEENVALVTFGKSTGIQQGFTNDFSLIRDAFDTIPLQIIPYNNVKHRIIQIVRLFRAKKYPVSCGAVNKDYNDEGLIDDISAIGGGSKIELLRQPQSLAQAKILGRYYLYQTIVAQVKHDFDESGGLADPSRILMDVTSNKSLDRRDREELVKMLHSHDIVAKFDESVDAEESDDEVLKGYTFQDLAHMPLIGTRVKKGPQWKLGMPDPGGLGTVVAHASEGVVVVKWDRGKVDRYQYRTDCQEVTLPGETAQPRQLRSGQDIDVGCWVKRGPQWSKGDEDGQASHGVVIRRHRNQSVTVKWPIGIVERYKCGQDGIMEVEATTYVPPGTQPQSHSQDLPTPTSTGAGATSGTSDTGESRVTFPYQYWGWSTIRDICDR